MNLPEFKNQPLTDFTVETNHQAMSDALESVRRRLGEEYDLVIGGQRVRSGATFQSLNPSRPREVVGVFQKGTAELVEKVMSASLQAFETWSRTPAQDRVKIMLRVSEIMKGRQLELAAWMVIEEGKSWVEADADVAEAIDFCEYYCRLMLKLDRPDPLTSFPGEENELRYIPLGVGLVIPPWNFPLAILAGMTFASIVSGNTVVLKPSSDSPAIAAQLMAILDEAGVPAGVVNFFPGSGSEIGDRLVCHPKTRFIAFTGSKEVGLRINRLAAETQPGQIWIKRVIAEMGGKDSIVVDDETDLDQAVAGVVASAFGFQGQKCSACSRAIVVESVYEEFLKKVVDVTQETVVEGDVQDGVVNFGPVINAKARESILRYSEIGKSKGRLLLGGTAGEGEGFFIRPTIIADVDPRAVIAQEEIFGPVLAVIRARDFHDALEIANNTEYGLTGAVYSRNEEKLRRAADEFHVGNLYLNRKCTGALVGVHPFGGFNMSGTDSKAGGPDYLLLFTQAKAISRKVG
jgi:1-pyrroline-5-carboxylate dehydrogenase